MGQVRMGQYHHAVAVGLLIADCRLSIADFGSAWFKSIGNRQSQIDNQNVWP